MRMPIVSAAALALAGAALAQNPVTMGEPAAEGLMQDVTLQVRESEAYGPYIVVERARGDTGRPVYMFDTDVPAVGDNPAQLTCTSAKCLQDWTPVNGEVTLGEGLDEAKLGSLMYEDVRIAVYGGWPLYTYEMDQFPMTDAPTGQGDVSFGGAWYLLSPEGEPIRR